MGSDSFTAVGNHPDIAIAFDRAHSEAVHHYGTRGYTGSLAEKHGYTVVTSTLHTPEAAYRLARELMDDDDDRINDKWGPAGAIPLTKVANERTVSISFKVRNSEGVTAAEVDTAVTRSIAAYKHLDETIGKIGKIKRTPIGKPVVKVTKTEAKPVIRYYVGNNHSFATEAEAIKAVRADPAKYTFHFGLEVPFETDLAIRPQVVGTQYGGAPSSPPTSVRMSYRTVEVSLDVTFHVAGTEAAGWLFFGYASS